MSGQMKDNTKTPMDALQAAVPEGARTYLQHKASIMENPELQALPTKYKLLVGIGVAAALQSSTCTLMWTKLAKQAGATRAEIGEAILVSRLMKMATVNDTAAEALAWLRRLGLGLFCEIRNRQGSAVAGLASTPHAQQTKPSCCATLQLGIRRPGGRLLHALHGLEDDRLGVRSPDGQHLHVDLPDGEHLFAVPIR
jgi:AhpD family alkylhydroperoxidase